MQEKIIFFPRKITEERWKQVADEIEGEMMTVATADGLKLHGWFLPGTGDAPRSTLLFFGGNVMRLDRFAYALNSLRQEGVNIVLIDYRGYGLSEGSPSTDAMRIDSEHIYDAATNHSDVDPDRIYLWGISIGTGVATHLASVRDVSGVILYAPFTSMVDVAREVYPYLPVRLLLRHNLDNIALAPSILAPALIVHGDADDIQGHSHAHKLAAAWGGEHELVIIKDRGHNDLLEDEESGRKVLEFVRR